MERSKSVKLPQYSPILYLVAAFVALTLLVTGCSAISTDEGAGTDLGTPEPMIYQDTAADGDRAVSPDMTPYGDPQAEILLAPAPGAGPDASAIPQEDRLIVQRVEMRLGVDAIDSAVESLRAAAKEHNGTIIDLNVSTDEGFPIYRQSEVTAMDGAPISGYLTVRVPAENLETFIATISEIGAVLRHAETQSDVTQEHLDLDARLKNLQASEVQLRDFLAKAKNVTEMLAVEKELSRIRGEIESMQAQIAYLERQAAHSVVTIELTGPKPIVRPTGEDWGFVAALTESVRAFVRTINTLIVLLGALTPVIIILALAALVLRLYLNRRRAMKAVSGSKDPAA
ncbi:MAG: DUF4349 domain-containing protein [Actinobacteria bacterium]|nr:DUF4349 domain-containing protein [Actinomycetota bacterium]